LRVRNLDENLLFSTLILASVFSDYRMSSFTGINSYVLTIAAPPGERQHQVVLNWPWLYWTNTSK